MVVLQQQLLGANAHVLELEAQATRDAMKIGELEGVVLRLNAENESLSIQYQKMKGMYDAVVKLIAGFAKWRDSVYKTVNDYNLQVDDYARTRRNAIVSVEQLARLNEVDTSKPCWSGHTLIEWAMTPLPRDYGQNGQAAIDDWYSTYATNSDPKAYLPYQMGERSVNGVSYAADEFPTWINLIADNCYGGNRPTSWGDRARTGFRTFYTRFKQCWRLLYAWINLAPPVRVQLPVPERIGPQGTGSCPAMLNFVPPLVTGYPHQRVFFRRNSA